MEDEDIRSDDSDDTRCSVCVRFFLFVFLSRCPCYAEKLCPYASVFLFRYLRGATENEEATKRAKKAEAERKREARANQSDEQKKTEAERKARGRAQNKEAQFYTQEELDELDAKGPEPVSEERRQAIMRAAYDAYHQPIVACGVCDQFRQQADCDEYLPEELPDLLFSELVPSKRARPLPEGLRKYYDVSAMFPLPNDGKRGSGAEDEASDSDLKAWRLWCPG